MNFVFISPHFPANYERFCTALKEHGVTVLGIADTPYEQLTDSLRSALTDYYRVASLEDYESVLRGVAYFIHRYGKIDWLESNNEYWLEQDARLREAFHITSGFMPADMPQVKHKSLMKACYERAGVPTARYHMVSTLDAARAFVAQVGYPVIVKPDNGVGACATYKLCSDDELRRFYESPPSVPYIMEEYVYGAICSYDAILNSEGEPLFESGDYVPYSIMEAVNAGDPQHFTILPRLPDDLRDAGRRCVKAFGARSRFVHFEFFRLWEDHPNLGRAGTIVGLEVNMRPCGGFTPDMYNYALSTDVYRIYADMICYDENRQPEWPEKYYCAFVGRQDGKPYLLSQEALRQRYAGDLMMSAVLPDVLAAGMGKYVFIARFKDTDRMDAFFRDALELVEQ
ncbi:carbamoylphosphate synthase large subunit [Beduinella massiliensis]|uniref:ATP-binding protein n=1 Tax=Beduinella massiliensis TaxID=1852363 RepID=UPI000C867EE7